MIENSKGKTVNPAIVEHMAMENEKLRGLLREVRVLLSNSSYKISGTAAFLSSIDAALSQQAEPVEPAPAHYGEIDQFGELVSSGATFAEPDPKSWQAKQAPAQDERDHLAAEAAYYRSTLRNVLKDIRDDLARGGLAPSWSGVAETIAIVLSSDRPAQTATQSVPDAVWEALQRMIETTHQLGPHSREDAQLVARYRDRYRLLAAPQPEQSGLVEALAAAAQSLEAISNRAGKDEFMQDMADVRSYARSRAGVARAALSAQGTSK